jgi:hypothetical protein
MSEKQLEALDQGIKRMRKGEDVEQVLEGLGDEAEELRPLLMLARDLGKLPASPISADSTDRMFASFVKAAAHDEHRGQRRVRFFSRGFLTRAAAVLLAVLVGAWATVAASADAVPGDWLYPIKRFTERAKFFLTINAEDKAELRIVFSSERLKEAVKRYEGSGHLDQALLEEMLQEARLAAESSETLPGVSRTLVAGQAAHLSEYQQQMLSGLKTESAPEHREVFSRYADMCGRRARWMRGMCSWRGPQGVPLPENQEPQQAPRQRNEDQRRWRDMCPMWGN